jgi:hypothetical protein
MPKYWTEMRGGTWTNVDLVANHEELEANTEQDRLRSLALSGDIALACSPATTGSSAAAVAAAIAGAASKFTRTVTVTLQTAAGDVHSWFSGTRNIAAARVGSGTIGIAASATAVTFVNGVGTVVMEYTGTWAAADTATLTVTGGTLYEFTVDNATSADTLVA